MNGLYSLKDWFTRVLSPFLYLAVKVRLSPNWLTLLGVLGAGLAMHGVVNRDALIVLVGVIIRLAGANLDGAVARALGRSSAAGFWINELGDRVSDWLLMGGFAWLGAVWSIEGFLPQWLAVTLVGAWLAAMLPTAVSLLGVSRGAPRFNGGPFGKTERCALAVVAVAALQFGLPALPVLASFALVVVLGSVATALLRWRKVVKFIASQ